MIYKKYELFQAIFTDFLALFRKTQNLSNGPGMPTLIGTQKVLKKVLFELRQIIIFFWNQPV